MPIGSTSPALRGEEDVLRAGMGIASWNAYPLSQVANQALTSQTVYAIGVGYRGGQVITNVGWVVHVAAAGAAPTGMFCGVCSGTTMLMDSANLAASSAWTTTGLRTVALSSPLTIPSDGLYYHLLLQNGAFGVTQPSFGRATATGSVQINGAGAFLFATAGVAATALPAVNAAVTLSAAGSPIPFLTFST